MIHLSGREENAGEPVSPRCVIEGGRTSQCGFGLVYIGSDEADFPIQHQQQQGLPIQTCDYGSSSTGLT